MTIRQRVWLEIDEHTQTITLRNCKHGTIQATIKVDASCFATWTRLEEDCDCDNFWIAVKPADSEVFENGLFDKRPLFAEEFTYRKGYAK